MSRSGVPGKERDSFLFPLIAHDPLALFAILVFSSRYSEPLVTSEHVRETQGDT